jgi:hypothetical protein
MPGCTVLLQRGQGRQENLKQPRTKSETAQGIASSNGISIGNQTLSSYHTPQLRTDVNMKRRLIEMKILKIKCTH